MFGMPKGRALVWKPGDEAPRVSWVKGYFEIPELNERASPNPYYQGGHAAPSPAPERGRRTSAMALVAAAAIVVMLLLH
jgi:hypothetical protein